MHKIVYIKTFKIAPTYFDPKMIFRKLHCSSLIHIFKTQFGVVAACCHNTKL